MLAQLKLSRLASLASMFVLAACSGGGGGSGSSDEPPPPAPTPGPVTAPNAVLSLSAATYAVNQNNGFISVVVNREVGGTEAVSVSYATSDGTAKAGTHYTATSGTLSWPANDSAPKSFNVAVAETPTFTGSRTLNVSISAPTGGATLGTTTSAVITINGSGTGTTPGTLGFGSATYSVSSAAQTVNLVLNRTGGASGTASVEYSTVDGTAKAGVDYVSATDKVTWASGDSAPKTVPISLITSGAGGRSFSVVLSNASGAGLGATASATVNITAVQACSKGSDVWQTCANWDWRAYGKYWVRNNIWGLGVNPGAGSQCMWVSSESCWGVTATHANGNGVAKGYPQAVRGWATGDGFKVNNSGMGIKVTELKKAKVHWTMQAPTGGRYMALWDIYLHDKANPSGSDLPRTSLMINQRIADDGYYAGEIANCPQGGGACPTFTAGGQTFRLWIGKAAWASGNVIQLFLTPTNGSLFGAESMTLDLKAVIDSLRTMKLIPDTDYLTSIQIGWEIIDGGEFETKRFWTALQDEPDPE